MLILNGIFHYLGHPVNIGVCSLFVDSPERLHTSALIENILRKLDNSKICAGNPDQKFQVLSDNRQGVFKDHAGCFLFYYIIGLDVLQMFRGRVCSLL